MLTDKMRAHRYERDERGLFCKHCGRSWFWHDPKNLFRCHKPEPHHEA